MEVLLALIHFALCAYLVFRMLSDGDVLDCQLGIIGTFSFGYFVLPTLFQELSKLDSFRAEDIFLALFIHTLFLAAVVVGASFGRRQFRMARPLQTQTIDYILKRYRLILGIAAFAIFIAFYATQDQTSYAADNLETYFRERSPFVAIVSAFGGLAQAALATFLAAAWRERNFQHLAALGSFFVIIFALNAGLGQRLVALTPIVMLLSALYMTGQRRNALRLLGITVVFLLFFSPFAVYLRESHSERGSIGGQGAISNYSIGENPVEKGFRSIIDRADLLYVTLQMKPHIDDSDAPGVTYYMSVFLIPFPKILIGEKPYLLSTDGSMDTELSVWAWNTLVGGIGSLTAFGGLVAYREGGWLWIPINGFLAGILFAYLARRLGAGGIAMQWLYTVFFVTLCVKKVPPSLFEALGEMLGQLPFIMLVLLVNVLLRNRTFSSRARLQRRRTAPPREVV